MISLNVPAKTLTRPCIIQGFNEFLDALSYDTLFTFLVSYYKVQCNVTMWSGGRYIHDQPKNTFPQLEVVTIERLDSSVWYLQYFLGLSLGAKFLLASHFVVDDTRGKELKELDIIEWNMKSPAQPPTVFPAVPGHFWAHWTDHGHSLEW